MIEGHKAYRAITIRSETVGKLLEALYEEYPEGASSMPDKLEEAVINTLYELDQLERSSVTGELERT